MSRDVGTFRANVDNKIRDLKDLRQLIDQSDKFKTVDKSTGKFKVKTDE